jgi:tetratricopeptide (TPR) repeat protein
MAPTSSRTVSGRVRITATLARVRPDPIGSRVRAAPVLLIVSASTATGIKLLVYAGLKALGGHGTPESMDCPRCGEPDVSSRECPRCGVILAKARAPRSRLRPPPREREPPSLRSRASSVLLVVVALAAAVWAIRRPPLSDAPPRPKPTAALPSGGPPSAPRADPRAAVPRPTRPAPTPRERPVEPVVLPDQGAAADQATAERLSARLRSGGPITADDVRAAEDLFLRYGGPAAPLLEAVLLNAAEQERAARRYRDAAVLLRSAAAAVPASVRPHRALVAVHLESGDWPAAEASARAALSLAPADPEAVRGLAYALHRQDRSREAVEVLESFLDDHDDASSRALLERIRGDVAPEAGLTEQRLAHFHVRYDGEEHTEVGREVLRLLERHYATLVRTFDHKPVSPIPVILLSRESYYTQTGAPAWSGGRYDSFDGRVRLPIGGLSAALDSEIDETLLHELTHAFITDSSRGVAPREIQEGLAQLVAGKRVETLLTQDQLTALAEGRIRGVGGFYLQSLSFVEYLAAQRGQGGINDLLQAMAETGDAAPAFERVYGRSFGALHRDWQIRLRNQYGR